MKNLEQCKLLDALVLNRVLTPGRYSYEDGMIIFDPISPEEYTARHSDLPLAYHTHSMGRGIFIVDGNGDIINYKGVDSRSRSDNVKKYNVTELLGQKQNRHETFVTYFMHGSYRGHKKLPQIRVQGASQLEDLISEQKKISIYCRNSLIKFPKIMEVKAFPLNFCLRYHLPLQTAITKDFIAELTKLDEIDCRNGNYNKPRLRSLELLHQTGILPGMRNQRWNEYFASLPNEDQRLLQSIPQFQVAVCEEDRRYSIGASFGQAKRLLENPFRISDLSHYVEQKDRECVRTILSYTQCRWGSDVLLSYADAMGRNTVGFMNEKLANHLWSHRQDFALSAEICDEAFYDVKLSLAHEDQVERFWHTRQGKADNKLFQQVVEDTVKYYGQLYLFASNMKVIEDAYNLLGISVPKEYQNRFVESLIRNVDNQTEILAKLIHWGSRLFNPPTELMLRTAHNARK